MTIDCKRLFFGIALIVLVSVAASIAIGNKTHSISSTGIILTTGLEIYKDAACTEPLTFIDWGTMRPGTVEGRGMYIVNTGSTNITLTYNCSSFQPAEIETCLATNWDYMNQVIPPSGVIHALFILTVLPEADGYTNFSFVAHIYGVEV